MSRIYRDYWDACNFVSLIERDSDRFPTLQAILEEAERGRVEIYTSTISTVEVSFAKSEKDKKLLDTELEKKINKLWLPSSPFKLVEASLPLMFEAQTLMRKVFSTNEWSLKPMDAIHLVTAKHMKADAVHTYDEKLFKYANLIGIKIEEPRTDAIVWPDDDEK